MKIFIKASPNSKHERIEKLDETHYCVWVKEPPVKGLANQAIIRVLAEYFKSSPLKIKIVSGYTSRQKTVEIV